jgi:hypothetical protein
VFGPGFGLVSDILYALRNCNSSITPQPVHTKYACREYGTIFVRVIRYLDDMIYSDVFLILFFSGWFLTYTQHYTLGYPMTP